MTDKVKKYLYDIKKSIEDIQIHITGIKTYEDFFQNLTVKRAIERELEIIGEAMNQLLIIEPEIKISDTRKIIAMRNRIIHGYDTVDSSVIWNVVVKNLPTLKGEIENFLK